jgi:nucleotide-binding universal stress UspA family protein
MRMTAPPRSIIVPVTYSDDAGQLVAVAGALAGALGAELILAGVAPLAPPAWSADGAAAVGALAEQSETQELVDRLVRERLEELAATLAPGVLARTVLTWGPMGAALVDAARDECADLIAVPMRRESELRHVVRDHADRYVLHHAHVPVIVVPTEARPSVSLSE